MGINVVIISAYVMSFVYLFYAFLQLATSDAINWRRHLLISLIIIFGTSLLITWKFSIWFSTGVSVIFLIFIIIIYAKIADTLRLRREP